MIRAVCFDLGGVVFDSPFPALAALERSHRIASGSINAAIVAPGSQGAWARHERGETDWASFMVALERDLSHLPVTAEEVVGAVSASLRVRPEMLAAIARIRAAGLSTAAITNNWFEPDGSTTASTVAERFDVFVESAREGIHKPDPAIFARTLERLGVEAGDAAFLDDVGRNLKAARVLGFGATIKVEEPKAALAELACLLDLDLR